ncbi:MAG: DUF1294 domain-containing protein [Oscillospiraceae bacterium]
MKILAIYLAAINAAAFVVMAVDKYRAQHQQWRVREFTLMLLALLGGSLGTLLAMCACHHKTQHKKIHHPCPAPSCAANRSGGSPGHCFQAVNR